eukprot:scaffold107708_cov39-Cyclotella_meneghiniana.AAC.1
MAQMTYLNLSCRKGQDSGIAHWANFAQEIREGLHKLFDHTNSYVSLDDIKRAEASRTARDRSSSSHNNSNK